MDRIAVLIPCYNESQTIGKVVRDWKEMLPEAVVYVYDNNSKDGTDRIAVEAGAVVRYEPLQGKGNVIRRMFREVDAECYLMVDGDDTYPAQAGPSMVTEVLEHQADMVVGDRLSSTYFSENKKVLHHVGHNLTRFFINRIFQTDIKDIMTGLRAFSYRFVKTFPALSRGFEIETEMTIHAVDKNMVIRNQVIQYRERPEGSESKLNTYSDGMKVLFTIARLYKNYKPMPFFGMISLILFVISLIFFIPVFSEYLATGLVARFPTLIVCGFTMTASLLSFFSGMILSCIVQKNRQDFELALHQCSERYQTLKEDVAS